MITPEFPEWSDLGRVLGEDIEDGWKAMLEELNRLHHYYSGNVFQEYQTKLKPTDPDIPLFPAGVNIVKTICTTIADAMFGEWKDVPVMFENALGEDDPKASDDGAKRIVSAIMRESGASTALWEVALDQNRYGGGVLQVSVDFSLPHKIRWSRVRRECFYPVWDPENPDRILEAYIATWMSQAQVKSKFGKTVDKDSVLYLVKWTEKGLRTWLDSQPLLVDDKPIYGVVPFAYIPRARSDTWWGEAITNDLIPLQDEFNLRMADIGDIIALNAHPIIWGRNLPQSFNNGVYPRGSNAMWDLGRARNEDDPEVGILEARTQILEYAFAYLKILLSLAREVAQTPAIAYGADEGGGQRSADTLEVRLRSLLASINRSRAYMTSGLRSVLQITSAIYRQKQFSEIPVRAVERIPTLEPNYGPVLPKSQPALVDEVIKLLSTDPPSISLETAEIVLGRGTPEVERIRKMVADEELWLHPKGEKDALNDQAGVSNGRARSVPGQPGDSGSAKDSE